PTSSWYLRSFPTRRSSDLLALDPAKFAQARHKSSRPGTKGQSIRAQEPDGRQFARLLRACWERPACRRATNHLDEIASLHSITSDRKSTRLNSSHVAISYA